MSKRKRKEEPERWSFQAGERPNTVTVYERRRGGILYASVWDPSANGGKGAQIRESLKHRDQEKAKAHALTEAGKLAAGDEAIRAGRVSLSRLFALYERHRTPEKGEKEQREDERRLELWTRVLGATTDPHRITRAAWDAFARDRLSGAIDARGKAVAEEDRTPVGPRAVERDLRFLLAVLRWGTAWSEGPGYLLRENCCRGYKLPKEKNPRRPVATWDRYEALRAKSDEVLMDVGRHRGESNRKRSHLSELLDLAVATGRRISAICQLRYSDLLLDRTPGAPFGAIRWPADTDKEGKESTAPLNQLGRAAIDRALSERPGIGDAPIFPSPKDPAHSATSHLADKWLREAERLAGLAPQEGSLWHAYRRMWATARKGLPVQDVARMGGWSPKSTNVLQELYQQADEESSLAVVLHEGRVRSTAR